MSQNPEETRQKPLGAPLQWKYAMCLTFPAVVPDGKHKVSSAGCQSASWEAAPQMWSPRMTDLNYSNHSPKEQKEVFTINHTAIINYLAWSMSQVDTDTLTKQDISRAQR